MSVIIFIIILAVLVFVHELGHFLVAKASGIRVDEFGLGFPPRLASFQRGETTYSINWIPFGGFVKIFGENPDEESIDGPDKQRSFVHKPKWIQALVLIAGISCNILFAWLLISIGFMSGFPVPQDYLPGTQVTNTIVTVTAVSPHSPADKAGLKGGDELYLLQSGKDSIQNFTTDAVSMFVANHGNQDITVYYKRGKEWLTTHVTPIQGIVPNKPAVGIEMDTLGILKLPFFRAFYEGGKLTVNLVKETAVGLASFIGQAFTGHAQLSQVSGPVGIAGLVGDATRLGFVYLLSFVAFISINLAVINLIPFPALDGGRLLFVLIESIKGSPINPKIANAFNTVGFVLLLLLMLVVTFHDILKLIAK